MSVERARVLVDDGGLLIDSPWSCCGKPPKPKPDSPAPESRPRWGETPARASATRAAAPRLRRSTLMGDHDKRIGPPKSRRPTGSRLEQLLSSPRGWLALAVVGLVGLRWLASTLSPSSHHHARHDWPVSIKPRGNPIRTVLAPLNGPPESFRSALVPDVKYLTAGHAHGNSQSQTRAFASSLPHLSPASTPLEALTRVQHPQATKS